MMLNKISIAVLVTGLSAVAAHATQFGTNANDVKYSQAHYQLTIASTALRVSIPGANRH